MTCDVCRVTCYVLAADQQCFGGGYDCIVSIGEAVAELNAQGQTTVVKGE